MSAAPVCPQCQAEIPAGLPCPRCQPTVPLAEIAKLRRQLVEAKTQLAEQVRAPIERLDDELGREQRIRALLSTRLPQLTILGPIGKGGMGEVWKAEDRALKRTVAIKVLPPEVGDEPEFAERFVREARALAELDNPRIVRIFDFSEVDGLYFLVMEFVPDNLRAYLGGPGFRARYGAKEKRVKYAFWLLMELCTAVQYAHDKKVVHRDLKPENILLTEQGRVKLADFGLARLVGRAEASNRLTGTRQVMGTPAYMAPEQVHDPQSADARSDVYALGVILYEVLTDELPRGHFEPPSAKIQDTRWDDIVFRAMARDPAKRYQTASEMRADLVKIQEKPYRTALLIDLTLFGAWCSLSVLLIVSLVLAMDLSTTQWLIWLVLLRWMDASVWSFPRARRLAHAQAFLACMGINLVGPLFGFERPEVMGQLPGSMTGELYLIGAWLVGYSIAIGWRIGTRQAGRAVQGWLAFAACILVTAAVFTTMLVLQGRGVHLLPWVPFIVTATLAAYIGYADHLYWQKVKQLS